MEPISSSTRNNIPKAAACQSLSTRAPRCTKSLATYQPTALSKGVLPAMEPPITSMFAPPLINVAATSTSSLLAAQCNWVSEKFPPVARALGSAPASISIFTITGPLRKYPGQSVTTCKVVRKPPLLSIALIEAKPGTSIRRRRNASKSPV